MMMVRVAVGNAAAVEHHAVIQQRSIAFFDSIKSSQEMVGEAHMVLIDFAESSSACLLSHHAGKCCGGLRARKDYGSCDYFGVGVHETTNTRRVRLKSQNHHVHQQFDVFAVLLWNTDRSGESSMPSSICSSCLSNAIVFQCHEPHKVFVQFSAVVGSQFFADRFGLAANKVENAFAPLFSFGQ